MFTDFIYLLAFAFVFYGSCLRGEFVFDDSMTIFGNDLVAEGRVREVHVLDFRGLSVWTLALTAKIWRLSTLAFHSVNVLIHAINGFLLLQIFQQLGFDHNLALVGALLFVGHPLAVSSAAYISQRSGLLSAMFGWLAVLCVLSGWSWFAIPAVILAIMAKEDAAILPVALLGIALVRHTTVLPILLLMIGLGSMFMWKRQRILNRMSHSGSDEMAVYGFDKQLEHPIYFVTAATETILRLPLWLCGLKLNIDPHIQVPSGPRIANATVIALTIGGILFTLPPVLQIGLILTVMSPILVSWFAPLPEPVMEYRAYMSLAGAGVLWLSLFEHLPWFVVTLFVAWQWTMGEYRVFDWQTQLSLWLSAARDGSEDKPRVISNIGAAYEATGDFKSAEPYLENAIKRYPTLGMPMANLAFIRAQQGKIEEARMLLERCVECCPQYQRAWQMLHAAYHHLKNDSGRLHCEEVLAGFKKG